ncbi:MAG: reverse transcriptase family protein [Bacteroidales bacterium]|nr:reverse transcriptase family protein [Bacteroidales bacterium]MCF8328115.1 reverse transcriptase family protein [Bacteroidales bacterium]
MYQPKEIANLDLLSGYLRTHKHDLNNFVSGVRAVYQQKSGKICVYNHIKSWKDIDVQYDKYHIPKKNPKLGYRIVYEIRTLSALNILKVLKFNLSTLYKPHVSVHGFVLGRGVFSNAKQHLANYYLLRTDIKNFFESINIDMVYEVFIDLGFIPEIAEVLSKITTLDNHLVQGLPTSPIIANLVLKNMDTELKSLCKKYNAVYTRYADDISISSNSDLPPLKEIENIVNKSKFKLNTKKTKTFKRGQNQFVTGLSICDNLYPRIPKKIKRKIRQELYYIKKFGYESHICKKFDFDEENYNEDFVSEEKRKLEYRIKGWVDYIHSIEPKVAENFYNDLKVIQDNEIKKMDEYGDAF